jgi:hypothetical protein
VLPWRLLGDEQIGLCHIRNTKMIISFLLFDQISI